MLATPLRDGRVLVVSSSTTAEIYDPATSSWSAAGQLSQPRTLGIAVRLGDGRVLVAGGGQYSATAELYNPATNSWTLTGSLPMPLQEHTATLLPDGTVLVAGGLGSSYTRDAELYDPSTGRWRPARAMTARAGRRARDAAQQRHGVGRRRRQSQRPSLGRDLQPGHSHLERDGQHDLIPRARRLRAARGRSGTAELYTP